MTLYPGGALSEPETYPGNVFETAARFKQDLLRRERQAAGELVQAYGQAWQRIQARLNELENEYQALKVLGEEPGATWIYEHNRLQALRQQIERELEQFGQYAEETVRQEQRQAIAAAEQQAETLVRKALGKPPKGVHVAWHRIDTAAVEQMLGFTQVGSPLHSLLSEIAGEGAKAAEAALVQGMLLGKSPRETARLVRQALGTTLGRALRIARTETMRAQNEATRASYQANWDILKGWVWHSAADGRTCASCFPAGVLVSGPTPQKVFSRHYTGDIVIIETTGGKHLPVTPNHPILTDHGWIKAGLLREGDNVICRSHVEGTAFGININDYHGPTPIEQVAKAFCMIPTEMPCSTPDFHGDGKGSNVYIVWSNGLLRNNREATRTEYFQESNFSSRGTTQPACLSFGLPPFGRGTTLIPRDLIWARMIFENDFPGFQWYFGAPQGVGFRKGAPFDTAESQTSCNCRSCDSIGDSERMLGLSGLIASGNLRIRQMSERMAKQAILGASNCIAFGFVAQQATFSQNSREAFSADSESGCDLLGGLAGQISIDRILNIYVRSFSGQVYNLQTKDGWYQANDIIVHNCWAMHGTVHDLDERLDDHPNGRCGMVPLPKSWADIGKALGVDLSGVPDTRPVIKSGAELFERLTAEQQRQILGPAKWAAWKDGKLTLSDLVGRKRSREWGTMRYERSLADVLGAEQAKGYTRLALMGLAKERLNADELIKVAGLGLRELTPAELKRVVEQAARAGFDWKVTNRITKSMIGRVWLGRDLERGDLLPNGDWHYLKHVIIQKEWPDGTTYEQYVASLKTVINDANSGIMVSKREGKFWDATFIRQSGLLKGPEGNDWILIEYRTGYQHWVTAFQPKDLDYLTRNRTDIRWLRLLKP